MVWFLKNFANRITLFLLPLLASQFVTGQEGVYKISWTENGREILESDGQKLTREYLKFDGAVYGDEYFIPVVSKTIKLNNPSSDKFDIVNLKFEPVPDSLLQEVDLPDEIPTYGKRANIYRGGIHSYLSFSVETIRRNRQSGHPERLTEYEIVRTPGPPIPKTETIRSKKSAGSSVLASGSWYKFKVNESGIYKLTYEDIQGMGLANPENVRIYGHGGKQLSYFNGDPRPIDLPEIPIYMNKGNDDSFGGGDYILFYAEGPVVWDTSGNRFKHYLHHYSGAIHYFLTTSHGPATKITSVDHSGLTPTVSVDSYNEYAWYEKQKYSLIRSGREWYSYQFDEAPFDTTFRFSNILPGSEMHIDGEIAGRSEYTRTTYLKVNNKVVDTIKTNPVSYRLGYLKYANTGEVNHSMVNSGSDIEIGFEFNQGLISDEAYLDYITLNTRCQLRKDDEALFFRDLNSVGEDKVANFTISSVSGAAQVWDITDITNVFALKGEQSDNKFEFVAPTNNIRQYVLLDINYDYPRPIIDGSNRGVGAIDNQNIRALSIVNYLIIAPEVFNEQAERLAEHHRQKSGLSVQIVSPELIYNEFSSGTPDVSAIRDFIRQHYQKSTPDDSLKYVLLFGDGSFNNHSYREGNTNFVLTYQSIHSLAPTVSYGADDFYALLDDDEGGIAVRTNSTSPDIVGKLDVGVGRLPVRSVNGNIDEAKNVVDKILRYKEESDFDWRRVLTFVGDDQRDDEGTTDGTLHMGHADSMTEIIGNKYNGFEFKKVYLDAYEQVKSSTGAFYPDAKEALMNSFNKGTLIFCYFGHGSENQLTGERVLQKTDVKSMKNNFLSLFVTATCQFSRFDDVSMEVQTGGISAKTSAGEEALLNPDGGAIGLFSTTRVVYSTPNFNLAEQLFNCIFEKDYKGEQLRLGDVSRISKNGLPDQINKLSFSLLGDPAMVIAYPEFKVFTDSVNGVEVTEGSDTLSAFGYVTVSGHVAYDDGTLIPDFNGVVYPRVYDKEVKFTTLGNDGLPPLEYNDQKNLIYKGKASVKDGRFTFSFVVPKDISYSIGNGKISYYATNSDIDAKGEFTDVYVGGTDEEASIDAIGPEIQLFMNDERFQDGGMTNSEPYLYAKLYDDNGINTTGIGIGHDIVATLDFEDYNSMVLNDFYESEIDDYRSGKVYYQLSDLEEGEHTLLLKAWDVYNNSSEEMIGFVVTDSDGLLLEKIVNYPNPASDYTTIQYTHNAPDEDHEIVLEIFDLSGRLVTSISRNYYESGFVSIPLSWDLKNSSGSNLGAGLYPYRLTVTTSQGKSHINQKLIIIR